MKNRIAIILTFFFAIICNGQEKIDINNLCKKWKLETFEKNGIIKDAEEFEKDETIIFYKNNKFKMIDSDQSVNGIWKFNYLTNVLELNVVEISQKINLKVLNLNADNFDYISEEIDSKLIFHCKSKL